MSLMMYPAKLLQWLSASDAKAVTLTRASSAWIAIMSEARDGQTVQVSEGTGNLPSEAIIKCWENYLTVSN